MTSLGFHVETLTGDSSCLDDGAQQDLDVVHAHFAGDDAYDGFFPSIDQHTEHGIGQHFCDLPF